MVWYSSMHQFSGLVVVRRAKDQSNSNMKLSVSLLQFRAEFASANIINLQFYNISVLKWKHGFVIKNF